VTHPNSENHGEGGIDRFFTVFSTFVAKWTGSHWAFAIVAVLVVVSLVTIGVEDTNIAIAIATLLMVFVLQNTQNRDSAALHLKLDEMIHAEPDAREIVRGIEVKSEAEIKGMTLEEAPDSLTPGK
jgi:low affinity Fe/Cu permease